MNLNPEQPAPTFENESALPYTTQNGGGSLANGSSDKKKDDMESSRLTLTSLPKNDATDKDSEDAPLTLQQWRRAYAATLFVMGSVVHIVASIVTVVLFFIWSFPPYFFIWPLPPYLQPLWLVPIYGSVITYIAFAIIAFFCFSYIGTVKGASTRSFGQLRARLDQLRARLDALGILGEDSAVSTDTNLKNAAKVEAYRCYESARWYLQEYRTGLRWVTGMGYINVWGLVHRAEEALVKVEPAGMVFRGAVHDRLAILESKIGKRDELLNKLTIAVTQLYPEGEIYIRENTSDDRQRLQTIENTVNEILANQRKKPQSDTDEAEQPKQDAAQQSKQDAARLVLSEIRQTLNEYRDNLWESILHERNRLMNTVALTGLVTHILLAITIVIIGITYANETSFMNNKLLMDKTLFVDKMQLMAATVYYVIGAVSGLFLRFWNEINSDSAIDDFGLSTTRLLATPLLSGLAGIGGVVISLLLSDALTNTQAITFVDMFQFRPSYFLTAAAFGLTPDLIIRGLQQKVAKYSSDLRRSKSGGQEDDNDDS